MMNFVHEALFDSLLVSRARIAGAKQGDELAEAGVTVGLLAKQTYDLGLDVHTIKLIPEQFESGENFKDKIFDRTFKIHGIILDNEKLDKIDEVRREALINHLPRG